MPLENGWFSESEVLWPGQRMALAVDTVLYEAKSEFQDILVFKSKTYGNVLVLDGVIQLTERDEHAYQEMITHIPLFAHAAPRSVLIIGGGDGGVLREVARHPCIERIVMCELDEEVCNISKRFFASTMATAFDDPRVSLLHMDGAKFMRETAERFDVIIVDSTDPVGPAETLFAEEFFRTARGALAAGGVMCTQGECQWLHLELIQEVMARFGRLFPVVDYAYTTVPTYPSGQIGFVVSCLDQATDVSSPARPEDAAAMLGELKYYSPAVHRAAFVLPAFGEAAIAKARKAAVPPTSRVPLLLSMGVATIVTALLLARQQR